MSDGSRAIKARPKRQVPAAVGGLLLVLGAALGVALWSSSQSERSPVLVAANDLEAGDTITASDFEVTLVAVGSVVETLPDSAGPGLVGSTVVVPVRAGTLVSSSMIGSPDDLVPSGMVLVGAVLEIGQYPSAGVRVGDEVRLVDTGDDAAVIVGSAEVFAVSTTVGTLGEELFISLLMDDSVVAGDVAGLVASDDLSVLSIGTDS